MFSSIFKNIKNLSLSFALFLLLLPFSFLKAQVDGGGEPPGGGLKNPLSGTNTITEFIQALLKLVVTIGAPVVVFFIIYSGFLFVVARGNPQKIEDAKKTFLWVVIGAAIVLGALVISTAIEGTINQIQSDSGFGDSGGGSFYQGLV